MKKPKPNYHVVVTQDDEDSLVCEVIVTFQPIEDIRYYTTISSDRYHSIDDALNDAKFQIADFMGRDWL